MACINNEEGLNPGIPQREDDTVLMSLLEDSVQLEYCDDERLKSVIQSLEAAINPNLINGYGSLDDSYELQDCPFDQLTSNDHDEHMDDDRDKYSASHDLDFSWIDVEMSSFSSPSNHDISSWYEEICEDNVGYNMLEYGVRDYSEAPLEEDIYSSLWQDTNGL